MAKLAWLWKRPSKDGKKDMCYVCYIDETGKQRQKSLGHSDKHKAERQVKKFERKLRMGDIEPDSMKLKDFLKDCQKRSRRQVRESTLVQYDNAMRHFIECVGNIDYKDVTHVHGERFIQWCFEIGNRPATVNKKVRTLKRMFQMAVERRQLDENPLQYLKKPKSPVQEINTYSNEECSQMIKIANSSGIGSPFRWDLTILVAFCTGLRKSELLNLTWGDIDFEKKAVHVNPKDDVATTWEWHIKDTDRRIIPLPENVLQMLADHQAEQPEGYPYLFIPPVRYDRIQERRKSGNWSIKDGIEPVNNFLRQFKLILEKGGIKEGQFHDLRRTCVTNWLLNGLKPLEVSKMAGHASFETTQKYYLATQTDLLDRTREATTCALAGITLQSHCTGQIEGKSEKA